MAQNLIDSGFLVQVATGGAEAHFVYSPLYNDCQGIGKNDAKKKANATHPRANRLTVALPNQDRSAMRMASTSAAIRNTSFIGEPVSYYSLYYSTNTIHRASSMLQMIYGNY